MKKEITITRTLKFTSTEIADILADHANDYGMVKPTIDSEDEKSMNKLRKDIHNKLTKKQVTDFANSWWDVIDEADEEDRNSQSHDAIEDLLNELGYKEII